MEVWSATTPAVPDGTTPLEPLGSPTVALTLVGLDVSNGEVERVLCDCVDHPMLVMVAQGPVIVGLSGLFDQVHPGVCGVPWGVAKRLLFLPLGKTSSMWK
jgi:hypothetical protein